VFATIPVSTRVYLTVGRPDSTAIRVVGNIGAHPAFGAELPDEAAHEAVRDPDTGRQLVELMADAEFLRITNNDITVIDSEPSVEGLERRCERLREVASTLEAKWPLTGHAEVSALPADLAAIVLRWAEGDDGKRAWKIGSASTGDLRHLLDVVVHRRTEIEQAVEIDSDLIWVLEAAAEARRELDERSEAARS
jgi:hypothetical protein